MKLRLVAHPSIAVTVAAAFPAGSLAEATDEWGVAHFVEHMLLNGSEHYPGKELRRGAERLGAYLHAGTGEGIVYYHISARAKRLMECLDLLCDMLAAPTLDADEFEREREVILQEIVQYDDDEDTVSEYAALRAGYGTHRLATSPTGTAADLAALTPQHLKSFHQAAYHDGVCVIVGDLSYLELTAAKYLLARVPDHEVSRPLPVIPALLPGVCVEERDIAQTHLHYCFPVTETPLHDLRNRAAVEVYCQALQQRLFETLREQHGLCYQLWAMRPHDISGASVLVHTNVAPAHISDAHALVLAAVSELASGGLSEDMFLRARELTAGYLAMDLQVSQLAAEEIVINHVVHGDRATGPMEALAAIDATEFAAVQDIAVRVGAPAIGVVGPHTAAELL